MKYIVISGASGAGKSKIREYICAKANNITFSVSWTTRCPRAEESEKDYTFVSCSQFQAAIREGRFLEWVKISNKAGDVYYGTPNPTPADGKHILFDIDTQGGLALRSAYPQDTALIFITAPKELISHRLTQREAGRMPPAVLEARLARIDTETATALAHYDHIVENLDVEVCAEQILRIIDQA